MGGSDSAVADVVAVVVAAVVAVVVVVVAAVGESVVVVVVGDGSFDGVGATSVGGYVFFRNFAISASTSLFEYPLLINICFDLLISFITSNFSEHKSRAL